MVQAQGHTETQAPLHAPVCVIAVDAAIRETLDFVLTEVGYQVLEAATRDEGNALLHQSGEPLVVLLDSSVLEHDGHDVVQSIAHDEKRCADHAFILMSTSPDRTIEACGDTLTTLRAPLLPMPFSIVDLVQMVQQAQDRLTEGPRTAHGEA